VEKGPAVWRIRITKLAATPLPRILTNTAELAREPDLSGAVWKLEVRERDLDSNVIALGPNRGIDSHVGADVDVLIHVLSGSGRLDTERGAIDLVPGALLWLPKRSRRQFSAGPDGLRYLTVHQKREILPLTPTVRQAV
jgi:quercetin dioxygenase-like cupin family protein